ncbi:hypothetical protein ES703_91048 [subsurface metagenome]
MISIGTLRITIGFEKKNLSGLEISQQLRNLEKKIDPFKKDKIRIIGEFINSILPKDLKNLSLKEHSLKGPVNPLKRKIKTLLNVLERKHRFSFNQILYYIENLEPEQKKVHSTIKPKRIDQDLDKLYINRLFEIIHTVVKHFKKLDEDILLTEGLRLFLQWNNIDKTLKLNSIDNLHIKYNYSPIEPLKYYIEGFDTIEKTYNSFLKNLKNHEIRILLVGFCFWGKIIEYLNRSDEIIYILEENLPIINLEIYNSIELLVMNLEWFSSEYLIKEIYNDIYDQTEGFRIIIEPWNVI